VYETVFYMLVWPDYGPLLCTNVAPFELKVREALYGCEGGTYS